MLDKIEQATHCANDDRKTGRHRLDRAIGNRFRPRRQDEEIRRGQQSGDVLTMPQELDHSVDPLGAHERLELGEARSGADDLEPQVRMRSLQDGSGRDERLVALLGTQVGDRDDLPHRGSRRARRVRVGVDPVRDHIDRRSCDPSDLSMAAADGEFATMRVANR